MGIIFYWYKDIAWENSILVFGRFLLLFIRIKNF